MIMAPSQYIREYQETLRSATEALLSSCAQEVKDSSRTACTLRHRVGIPTYPQPYITLTSFAHQNELIAAAKIDSSREAVRVRVRKAYDTHNVLRIVAHQAKANCDSIRDSGVWTGREERVKGVWTRTTELLRVSGKLDGAYVKGLKRSMWEEVGWRVRKVKKRVRGWGWGWGCGVI
ncbi:hypothetical protein LTR95_007907 [Oleoguttula sp. CCFEE 5521]